MKLGVVVGKKMLRITPNSSEAGAKAYYTEGLARADYYVKGQEVAGSWGGKSAAMLGLSGPVSRDGFFALCENRKPGTDERLTARTNDARRVGYDFTFNAPKSVSVMYALHRDERLLAAFRAAVTETMQELEGEVRTRVRRGGQNSDRVTGNLVWGEFVHFTARPVDGVPDPHLHVHCFALNCTYDAVEARWKAAEFGGIKRDAAYFEAAFHSRLAKAVSDQGYTLRHTDVGWEIAGVPDRVLDAFSRRTQVIEAKAEALGIQDPRRKAELGAKTRDRKATRFSEAELSALWEARIDDADRQTMARVAARQNPSEVPPQTARAGVAHAIEHCFERNSVASEKEILGAALWHTVGSASVADVKAELARADVLKRVDSDRVLMTTPAVLAEERRMVEFARMGRGSAMRLAPSEQVQPDFLNAGQVGAIRHVWDSHDRVIIIRGGAGTGKTTLMREAVRGLASSGHAVLALAPTAEAARSVLRKEGFHSAETVARFLHHPALQEQARGGVIWIDEAGLLGARTMGQVFEKANALNARVVLSGDTRQHRSVERGDALRLLEHEAGLVPAEVTEIQRQQGSYKQAVAAIARGDARAGYAMLEAMGAVYEDNAMSGHRRLASDYVAALEKGQSVLVVSPTHREGSEVTDAIRSRLKERGKLGAERSFESLTLERWTLAERRDARQYRAGQVVVFHANAKSYRPPESISLHRIYGKPLATIEIAPRGIAKGERLTVMESDGRTVTVRDARGETRLLPLGEAAKFDVYRREVIGLAAGDRLRFTRNAKTADGRHELRNGALHEVAGFTPTGDIRLANGWMVSKQHGHFTHGYATTSHASQGKTVDAVFIAERAASLGAASAEQFYVSVSRARREVRIYTDDKEALARAVAERGTRLSGLELMKQRISPPAGDRRQRLKQQAESLMQRARATHAWVAQKVQDLLPNSGRMK